MKHLLLSFLCFFAFVAAEAREQAIPSGVQYELIGSYDLARINKILTEELKEFSDFPVTYPDAKYAVKLYRITYESVIPEQQNRPTVASGLLAVPDVSDGSKAEGSTFPVLSYQHGTVFTKTAVPSHPDESMETRLMIANFAAQGYIVIGADYFGKGLSTETDGYLVKASTQQAALDHLKAAQAVSAAIHLKWGPLFLSGWSQGGWATLAFLNKLEASNVPVKAAATASGPADIYTTINGWLHAPTDNDASYIPGVLCLQIHACEAYYRIPGLAAAAIRAEYRQTARALYLNEMTYEEAAPKLPSKAIDLFNEAFLTEGDLNTTPYWQILQNTQNYRWRSKTPIRAYYGQADEVASPYVVSLPVHYQKAVGGAEATAEDAGETANHRGTFLYAIAAQKKWFDSLLSQISE